MLENNEKLGAFIIPTGIGASIGGFAGDASFWARKFSGISKLIVNPNVVNAGCFSGINSEMFYIEGYSLDEFFKGNLNFIPSQNNKIGVIFDKAIPQDVLNVHINTIKAVKCVYGVEIQEYVLTEQDVGIGFDINSSGISTGTVQNPQTIIDASKKLLQKGIDAIALVCLFEDPEEDNEGYSSGSGVDPVGGIEAVLSHIISKNFKIPTAHSPAFTDYQIYPDLVSEKAAAEYITPTFLPCILLGLSNAPKFCSNSGISINNLDFLIMPYNSLGSTPVFECMKRNIPIFAIKENSTVLNVTAESLTKSSNIKIFETYQDCYDYVSNLD
ncbi:DUF3326 domain-containing protein [bacterium]|nr:DUF3326 domain-containing protein [bacterium]